MKFDVLNKTEAVQSARNIGEGYGGSILYGAGVYAHGHAEEALSRSMNSGYLRLKGPEELEIAEMFGEDQVPLKLEARGFVEEISDFGAAESLLRSTGYEAATRIEAEEVAESPGEAIEEFEDRDIMPELVVNDPVGEDGELYDTQITYNRDDVPTFDVHVSPTRYTSHGEATAREEDIRDALREFNIES